MRKCEIAHLDLDWFNINLLKILYSRFNFKMNTVIVTVNKYELKGVHTHRESDIAFI